MSDTVQYELPKGKLGLKGPMTRPAPGTLPLRGDLAHIALAESHLVPHYVIPQFYTVGDDPVELKLDANAGSDTLATLASGSTFEVLDHVGDWYWGCVSAKGPSGYVPRDAVTPDAA
ncbi:SH3 domain-containing protein [Pontixanthobacter aquaemixtae]|uniref:SH3 domain-containing protein n=1 Tax=Pontixanthobacter aquaemixtae TaxID=1958940 RepID=A0A844ZP60_9SPHN|nr:hypothetical protein [Pontixanthobacter aquaemixtae]MXO89523.1 hypothetical protein [Pontixanthobacter aquaemixtae]